MLHDALPEPDLVDSGAALEFMKEATKLASTGELEDIGERLQQKSAIVRGLVGDGRVESLDEAGFARLTGTMFSLRRKSGRLLRRHGLAPLRDALSRLLAGDDGAAVRIDRFAEALDGPEHAAIVALASETLHFAEPDRFWLWTHWIWNPRRRTGALALVTRGEIDLDGDSDGAVYEQVGGALAAVDRAGHALGYSRSAPGLFGTDVFLASVYAVYMYTVFRVKLSQEFNRILPELPELVRRILGVHRLETEHGS